MGGEKYMKEPKLRFKADDGSDFPDWEDVCFGSLYEKNMERNTELEFDSSKTISIASMSFKEQGNGASEDSLTTYKVLRIGDIAFEGHENKEYKYGRFVLNDIGDGIMSPRFSCLRPVSKQVRGFWKYYIHLEQVMKRILVRATKKGTMMHELVIPDFLKQSIMVPSLPEQQKIADFLSTIDTIIEKQRATVLAWEERKKGVMQKLFSQEVRFKADDGSDFPDWEEKSFVNTFDSLNNSTFSRDCLNYENGSVKYIHYGDILVKYNSSVDVCDAIVPFVNEDLDCERFAILQDGDIVIADTAEDDTVGKVIEIENTSNVKTIAGLHTIACRPKEKFASKYLGYYMNSDEYHNQLRPYMQGIKVTSISKSNIALTKIMVPSLPEQQKIADCLSALDTVIQKQKETLEKWQELKKGLLQQMFV